MERNCPSNVPERFGDAYEPRINARPRRGLWAIAWTQVHVDNLLVSSWLVNKSLGEQTRFIQYK